MVVRRHQQGKRAVRDAERELAQRLSSTHGDFQPPSREDCSAKQWETPYDDANTVRVQFNLWRSGGRLVDFVVNVQILGSQGWATVEYFDCCHGHCHHHNDNDDLPVKTVERLDEIGDVQRAFEQVEPLIDERVRIIRGKGV